MTSMVSELFEALKAAGVDDDKAKAAAQSVVGLEKHDELATKQFIAQALAELKADIMKWTVAMMVALTGIFAAIVKLF